MIAPQIIPAASTFPAFLNDDIVSATASIAGQNLGAGRFVSVTASATLDNTNDISQVQAQYSGVNSNFIIIPGFLVYNATANYQIESLVYYSGGSVNVFTVVSNRTGGTVAIPDIAMTFQIFTFTAPFS